MTIEQDEHRTPVFPGGTPLQIALWTTRRAFINFTGVTDRIALPLGCQIAELTATENAFIAFGDDSVDAVPAIASGASRLFLAGVQSIVVPLDAGSAPFTHIAVIRQTTDGILQVEQLG